MKAYKCDICGELYERTTHPKIAEKTLYTMYMVDKSICDRPFKEDADICPCCISAIQNVIDERNKATEAMI